MSLSGPPSPLVEPQTCSVSKTTRKEHLKVFVLTEPSPFTYISGYANRFQALCQYLVQDFGDNVQVVTAEVVKPNPPDEWNVPSTTRETGESAAHATKTVPIHYTSGITCPGYSLLSLSLDWQLKLPCLLWRERPDIIHVSSPGFLVFGALFWSRLLQIPLVCSYHTHLPRYVHSYFSPYVAKALEAAVMWPLLQIFLPLADVTIVTSPQIQQEFVEHGVGESEVWPKGIDTHRFHPSHFNVEMRRRMLGNPTEVDSEFLILYVGRLSNEKRLADLRPILQQMPNNTTLCFVGLGPQEEELKQLFAGTRTVFMGQLQGIELSQAFASADVFVMPSDSETLGLVVLESMASGCPVVGVRAGGVPDLIEHEHDGYLVSKPGDTREFVHYLRAFQQNPTLRNLFGERARQETQRWSWQASVGHIRRVQYSLALEKFENRWDRRLWRFVVTSLSGIRGPGQPTKHADDVSTSLTNEDSISLRSI